MDKITVKKRVIPMNVEPTDLISFVEGKATYSSIDKELTLTVNESMNKLCWRVVYNLKYGFIHFFESNGVTSAIWDMFCGTKQECLKEAGRLGLVLPEEEGKEVKNNGNENVSWF